MVAAGTLLIQLNLSHNARPYGHLENVITHRDFRGNGFGGQIVKHLTEIARERDCYKVVLNCKGKNVPFYEKCGYQKTINREMRINL